MHTFLLVVAVFFFGNAVPEDFPNPGIGAHSFYTLEECQAAEKQVKAQYTPVPSVADIYTTCIDIPFRNKT